MVNAAADGVADLFDQPPNTASRSAHSRSFYSAARIGAACPSHRKDKQNEWCHATCRIG
jgi:hypothetical protein